MRQEIAALRVDIEQLDAKIRDELRRAIREIQRAVGQDVALDAGQQADTVPAVFCTNARRVGASGVGIEALADIAFEVNRTTQNIGARRLYTVMEKLLEDLSFNAAKHTGETVTIDNAYVDVRLKDLSQSEDLARYVL